MTELEAVRTLDARATKRIALLAPFGKKWGFHQTQKSSLLDALNVGRLAVFGRLFGYLTHARKEVIQRTGKRTLLWSLFCIVLDVGIFPIKKRLLPSVKLWQAFKSKKNECKFIQRTSNEVHRKRNTVDTDKRSNLPTSSKTFKILRSSSLPSSPNNWNSEAVVRFVLLRSTHQRRTLEYRSQR